MRNCVCVEGLLLPLAACSVLLLSPHIGLPLLCSLIHDCTPATQTSTVSLQDFATWCILVEITVYLITEEHVCSNSVPKSSENNLQSKHWLILQWKPYYQQNMLSALTQTLTCMQWLRKAPCWRTSINAMWCTSSSKPSNTCIQETLSTGTKRYASHFISWRIFRNNSEYLNLITQPKSALDNCIMQIYHYYILFFVFWSV